VPRTFELFVAGRYLRAKRKQAVISVITVISVIGVAAGVMALVIALAINNGMRATLQNSLLGAYAHVNVMEKEQGYGIENWDELTRKLRKLPHVIGASPTLYTEVYVYTPAASDGAVVKGINIDSELETSDMLRNLKAGSLADLKQPSGPQGIVLGDKLAARLGAKLGNPVNVLSPQGGDMTPLGMRPRNERFRVVGVFSSGFYELDSAWAYISLESAQRLLNVDDVVNNIELKLDDIYAAPEVARAAEAVIGPKLGATTWMEQNKHIFGALNMERNVTFITIGLIVLVAALNILNSDHARDDGHGEAQGHRHPGLDGGEAVADPPNFHFPGTADRRRRRDHRARGGPHRQPLRGHLPLDAPRRRGVRAELRPVRSALDRQRLDRRHGDSDQPARDDLSRAERRAHRAGGSAEIRIVVGRTPSSAAGPLAGSGPTRASAADQGVLPT
jgi:lipoprotein-releasing system permease protein